MKFSETHAMIVFCTLKKYHFSSYNTYVLNIIYLLREIWKNLTKFSTFPIVYYEELHIKYTTCCGESIFRVSFTMQSRNSPCCLLRGVTVTSGESTMKI